MTIQELKQLYERHNIFYSHKEEDCEICKRWKEVISNDNPMENINGNNF